MTQHFSRRALLAAIVSSAAVFAALPQQALAYDETSTFELNVDAQGVAIKGHDPVAYFNAGQPTKGTVQYSASHRGATYWFASAANRDAFKASPDKFAPQFGGFCAMGVALNKKLDGDPTAWKIVDGKLYLNVSKTVQQKWLEDVPGNLVKANATWPEILHKAPKDL